MADVKAEVLCSLGETEIKFDGTENDLFTKLVPLIQYVPAGDHMIVEVGGTTAEIEISASDRIEDKVKLLENRLHLENRPDEYKEIYLSLVSSNNGYEMYHLVPNKLGPHVVSFTGGRKRIGASETDLDAKKTIKWPVPICMYNIWVTWLENHGYKDVTDAIGSQITVSHVFDSVREAVERADTPVRRIYDFLASCSRQVVDGVFASSTDSSGSGSSASLSTKVHFSSTQVEAARTIWNSFGKNQGLADYLKAIRKANHLAGPNGKFPADVIAVLQKDGCSATTLKQFETYCARLYMPKAVEEFNNKLHDLMAISPRRIDKYHGMSVKSYEAKIRTSYAKQLEEFQKIVEREETYLQAMEAVMFDDTADQQNMARDEIFPGITITPATDEETEFVKRFLTSHKDEVDEVYRVNDIKRSAAFEQYCASRHIDKAGRKLLWHGSKNENWLSIVATGLQLNPNAAITGKAFGDGIYFAPDPDKSFGYTSGTGSRWAHGSSSVAFMGLYETAIGKEYNPTSCGQYTQKFLDEHGCDSVWAKASDTGFYRDEVILYSEQAMCLRYLVKFAA